jgi:glycosyltransferase involved in cell wall biosynthesis
MKPAVVFVVLQAGAQANGGLESITQVMQRLKDHRPIVITNLDSKRAQSWRGSGIETHVIPEQASAGLSRDPSGTLLSYRRYHQALSAVLRASGARIIHANDPLAFQLSLAPAKLANVRLVLNLRDTVDPARNPPSIKFRAIFAAADHVLYLSADMARRWVQVAGNAARSCSITYSIVDPERFAPSAPSHDGSGIVLVPGVFWQKKGQLDFIRNVVPALAAQGIESWFAGDFDPDANDYAAACAAAAERFGDKVRFLGYRSDFPDLIHRASVVAIPSRHEGLMRGMIEAMSCGRPVVSFDVCSAREVLEREPAAGVVLRMDDHEGMATALIRYTTDREAQIAAGRAGSVLARQLFDPHEVAERHERVYRELGKRR